MWLQVVNPEGTWVKLDSDSIEQFCQNKEGEAWALARSKENTAYLVHESQLGFMRQNAAKDPFAFNSLPPHIQQGFEFAGAQGQRYPLFGQAPDQSSMFTPNIRSTGSMFALGGYQGR